MSHSGSVRSPVLSPVLSPALIKLVSLLCSVISGVLFAFVWRNYEQTVVEVQSTHHHIYGHLKNTHYEQWLQQQSIRRHVLPEEFKSFANDDKNSDFILESEYLFSKVRVLCLVLTKSRKRAHAVRLTWANHCNEVVFFGPYSDHKIPVMKYPASTSHSSFCHSFLQMWSQYSQRFDWLLIASDQSYAIVENLRHYVAPLNASSLYYLGRAVKHYFTIVYNSAESGIVLSRGAAQAIRAVFHNTTTCEMSSIDGIGSVSRNFDVSIAMILARYGCGAVDTRDLANRGRFHAFAPEKQLIPGMISIFNSYWRSSVFMSPEGVDCCSDLAITFSGIDPPAMYLTEYLLYHMSVFSNSPLGLGNRPPPYSAYKVSSDLDKRGADLIEVGTPLIQAIDKRRKKHKKNRKQKKYQSISNFLQDFLAH